MKLRDYLKQRKITQKGFAKLLKVEETYLNRYLNSHINIGRKLAQKIEEVTNGYVTFLEAMHPLIDIPTKGKKKEIESKGIITNFGQMDLF